MKYFRGKLKGYRKMIRKTNATPCDIGEEGRDRSEGAPRVKVVEDVRIVKATIVSRFACLPRDVSILQGTVGSTLRAIFPSPIGRKKTLCCLPSCWQPAPSIIESFERPLPRDLPRPIVSVSRLAKAQRSDRATLWQFVILPLEARDKKMVCSASRFRG